MIKKITNLFKSNKNHEDLTNKNIVKVDSNDIYKNSVAVENYNDVLFYICDDIKRSIKLTSYMKDDLTKLFGKHNCRFQGEYHYYVWIVEFEGEIFQIFTHNIKGTCFSIVGNFGVDKTNVCINFLRKMEELLDNI
jgi:hypothetical protein